ncbi:MAG TPA: hypothetical protein VKR26_16090, partial [Terriglobales bacterium]|nr:hypothetical protein [Terriglobales bacterium]
FLSILHSTSPEFMAGCAAATGVNANWLAETVKKNLRAKLCSVNPEEWCRKNFFRHGFTFTYTN